jgi:hypothetical protein
MTMIRRTYVPENHDSFQARGEEHEDRRWKVAYDPNKDYGELCQGDGRHTHVDSFDDVSLKIRE